MGNSNQPAIPSAYFDSYTWDNGSGVNYTYNPGLHPGTFLLPPSFLLQYDSLPDSILA
jgi:hypothetical protein